MPKYNVQIWIYFRGLPEPVDSVLKDSQAPVPFCARNKGARDIRRKLPRTNHIDYCSDAESWDSDFLEHWECLKLKFKGHLKALKEIAGKSETVLCSISVDHVGRFPVLYFEKDFIEFLRQIGADLEVNYLKDEFVD